MAPRTTPKPPPLYPGNRVHWGWRLAGAIAVIGALTAGAIEIAGSSQQLQVERDEILLKLRCEELRTHADSAMRSFNRRQYEAECRRRGML